MTVRKKLLAVLIFVAVIGGVYLGYTILSVAPYNPLKGHEQIVLVVSKTENAPTAVLHMYDRDGDKWRFKASCPVVLGRAGMAWGRGLHRDRHRLHDEPVKKEGDGASPAGAFELLNAYGYPPPSQVRIRFPYTPVTTDMICIDDVWSEQYNTIVRADEIRSDSQTLPSHEKMLRDDNLYKYTIFVGHNVRNTKPGAGSCIFLHIWDTGESPTAGCTAMAEENILQLLAWLDPAKKPCLVQLTRKDYRRLRGEWGLPDIVM